MMEGVIADWRWVWRVGVEKGIGGERNHVL